jgi:hypothetical protein
MATKKKKELSDCTSPEEYLRLHKIEVAEVVRVYSAGDSDIVGCETILFLTPWRQARTAIIRKEWDGELTLICRDGWDVFNPAYA